MVTARSTLLKRKVARAKAGDGNGAVTGVGNFGSDAIGEISLKAQPV
jgi:hypothetical protein